MESAELSKVHFLLRVRQVVLLTSTREGGIAAVYVLCVLKVTDSIKEFGQAALCYLRLDGLGG